MQSSVLALAFLACAGHGRRQQTTHKGPKAAFVSPGPQTKFTADKRIHTRLHHAAMNWMDAKSDAKSDEDMLELELRRFLKSTRTSPVPEASVTSTASASSNEDMLEFARLLKSTRTNTVPEPSATSTALDGWEPVIEIPYFDETSKAWMLPYRPGKEMMQSDSFYERLPPLPRGELKIGTDESSIIGGTLWDSACLMCCWLGSMAEEVRGSSIIELGSGTGACGLYAAGLGASRVLLTDGFSEVVENLRKNVAANYALLSPAEVKVAELLWESDLPHDAGPYKFVLASDVLYNSKCLPPLCSMITKLLVQSDGTTRCIISVPHRSSRGPMVSRGTRGKPFPWDESSHELSKFVSMAEHTGLVVKPLFTHRHRICDHSIFEVSLDHGV